MDPHIAAFGGGAEHSYLNPYVLALLLLAGIFIIFSSRQRALMAMLTVGIMIPMDQVLVIAGFHFQSIRILILWGIIRMLREKFGAKTDIFSGGMNKIDKAVILFTVFTFIDGMLLWREFGELNFQFGNMYTAFGLYFLMRFLIREEADIRATIRTLAYVSAFVAVLAIYERSTGYNMVYTVLNGARAATFAKQFGTDDRIRAAVSFGHPILAGTYGAIILPMFVGLWWKYKADRKVALLGVVAACTIAVCANSSTSLMGLIGGLFGLFMWPARKLLRTIRWGIVVMLVSLHMVMKAPVWALISRIDLTGGSSSDHRYEILNQCIIHFTSWFMWGTKDYASWGWSMYDLGNQYVFVADTAGLIPLIFFLAIIVMGFKYLGSARKAAEEKGEKQEALYLWALGAMLFANVVSYFGISYFDQTIMIWYAQLAIISAATLGGLAHRMRRAQPMPAKIPLGQTRLQPQGANRMIAAEKPNRSLPRPFARA